MKAKMFIILLAVVVFTACKKEETVVLTQDENIPEVAEQLLGMTYENAMQYLEKQRFAFGVLADNGVEYGFSRDLTLKEFSYDATELLVCAIRNDTVIHVYATHRSQTRKSASDLYGKWSHYTAQSTFSKVEQWTGSLSVDISEDEIFGNTIESYAYNEGTLIDEQLKQTETDYKNGIISKEEYEELKEMFSSRKRSVFRSDLRRYADKDMLESAYEYYRNSDASGQPKETSIELYMNNGGKIEVRYETQNFITRCEERF